MVKKAIIVLVIGFAIYYLLSYPEGAADAVENAFDGVFEVFDRLGIFFRELIS